MLHRDGVLVKCEIYGEVQVNSHISGLPDLTLSFKNPSILDDVRFHPCVRFRPWESHQILSFVPPDGQFKLMSYRCVYGHSFYIFQINVEKDTLACLSSLMFKYWPWVVLGRIWIYILDSIFFNQCLLFKYWPIKIHKHTFVLNLNTLLPLYRVRKLKSTPLYLKPQLTSDAGTCRISLLVGIRNDPGKTIDSITVQFQLPPCILSADLSSNHGTVNILSNKVTILTYTLAMMCHWIFYVSESS